jgi:hypothetical protein
MNTRVYNAMMRKMAASVVDGGSGLELDENTENEIGMTSPYAENPPAMAFYGHEKLEPWTNPKGVARNIKTIVRVAKNQAKEAIDIGKQKAAEGIKKADEVMDGGLGGSVGAIGGGLVGALIAAKLAKKLSGGKKALAILAGLGLGGFGGYKIGDSVSGAIKKAEAKKAEKADKADA